MLTLQALLGDLLLGTAAAYAVLALIAPRPREVRGAPVSSARGVTVLKPLCGAETHLFENLSSLCVQTLPDFQIVCGVRDPNDAAIAVVNRVRAAHPECDIELVVDPRVHGTNLKVSNLMNLVRLARHEVLVVADSDIGVPPDYLERLALTLADERIGLVTCLYRGRPVHGLWSRVGALFIDTWFLPSVRIAHWFGARTFGFGATVALRRSTLSDLGGFAALRNRLADDYWLAEGVRALGLATAISEVCVITDVSEAHLLGLWTRELRWLRTIRSLNPLGFFFTFITYTLPVVAIGLALAPSTFGVYVAALGVLARLGLHWRRPAPHLSAPGGLVLAPLRDLLLLAGWAWALVGRHVEWRDQVHALNDSSADPHP